MSTQLVPFGKYKGQPVEAMLSDVAYCSWLSEQPWLKDRFPVVQTLIINNFGEPDETPEHNEIQNSFYKYEYLHAFIFEIILKRHRPEAIRQIEKLIKLADEEKSKHEKMLKTIEGMHIPEGYTLLLPEGTIATDQYSPLFGFANREVKDAHDLENVVVGLEKKISKLNKIINNIQSLKIPNKDYHVESECFGWDLVVMRNYNPSYCHELYAFDRLVGVPDTMVIEIKPEIGDDFPAILRQMKANRERARERSSRTSSPYDFEDAWCYLVYKSFNASSASEDDVKRQFGASGFVMVREDSFWPAPQDVADNYLATTGDEIYEDF